MSSTTSNQAKDFSDSMQLLAGPVTGKDLQSFASQLESVANQLTDLAAASRMETLASRTRRLVASHIRLIEEKKESLVYQLTALEVQMAPLLRQVNQSLSHFKTIQYFISNQGSAIAHKKSREYVNRLEGYMKQYRAHVLDGAHNSAAPCTLLWTLFNSARHLLCRHIIDPLNGFWIATVWCLLVFLASTPVCLKLVHYYRLHSGISKSTRSTLPEPAASEAQTGGWTTPGRIQETREGW